MLSSAGLTAAPPSSATHSVTEFKGAQTPESQKVVHLKLLPVEEVLSKLTPTRLRTPPVRVTAKTQPSPEQTTPKNVKPSPLEQRPPWDGDFHVNRKDFSKPKQPARPVSAMSPGIQRPNGSEELKPFRGHVSPISRLPRRAGTEKSPRQDAAQSDNCLFRSKSMDIKAAVEQDKANDEMARLMDTCREQQKKISLLEADIAERTERICELEAKLSLEQKRRVEMEAEYAKQEAEVLKAWEKEFERGKRLAAEVQHYRELYVEADGERKTISGR